MRYHTISLIILISLLLNFSGSFVTTFFDLPLFLDAPGTILCAVMIGPWIGGLVGLVTNILKGIFYTTHSIPFGVVNFGVGVIAGYMTIYLKGYQRPITPLLVGVATAFSAAILAAPIATYIFGGITAHGIDRLVVALVESGQSVLSSAFWGRIPYSFVDKLLSAYMVFFIIKAWRGVSDKRFVDNDRGRPNG